MDPLFHQQHVEPERSYTNSGIYSAFCSYVPRGTFMTASEESSRSKLGVTLGRSTSQLDLPEAPPSSILSTMPETNISGAEFLSSEYMSPSSEAHIHGLCSPMTLYHKFDVRRSFYTTYVYSNVNDLTF